MSSIKLIAAIAMSAATSFAQPVIAQASDDYMVEVGDKLSVSVYGKPELSGDFRVRGDGMIVLHLLGEIEVVGLPFSDIEDRIVERAAQQFSSRESALVDIAEFRNVFVLGAVQTPGAYEYQPGLNVMKAVALAGGFETVAAEARTDREVDAARRRVLESQNRLRFAEAEQFAIEQELARINGVAGDEDLPTGSGLAADQKELVSLRRSLSERFTEGAERKRSLAMDEAGLFQQRSELVNSQLTATEEQLVSMTDLANRGLARRDQLLQLQVDLNDLRADALEAAAFEARARQTAANAESDASVEQTEYRHSLLDDKIAAEQRATLERAELEASLTFLREVSPSAAEDIGGDFIMTVYEIYKSGAQDPVIGDITTPLGPDDTLTVRFESTSEPQ